MTCTVTIGIPFLNARRYLADAVRSVFAQTFADWELILIDDGSTDGSLDVVRNLHDPRAAHRPRPATNPPEQANKHTATTPAPSVKSRRFAFH